MDHPGQELWAFWPNEVDALGERRYDAVGLAVGARDTVSRHDGNGACPLRVPITLGLVVALIDPSADTC